MSPHDVAYTIGRALGRQVRYQDVSTRTFTKFARASGFDLWLIAQCGHFAEELRGGTYAVGAPNDHVEVVCGRPPEEFEVTAERYFKHSKHLCTGNETRSKFGVIGMLAKAMLTATPNFDAFEANRARPKIVAPDLAHESDGWLSTAKRRELDFMEIFQNGGPK